MFKRAMVAIPPVDLDPNPYVPGQPRHLDQILYEWHALLRKTVDKCGYTANDLAIFDELLDGMTGDPCPPCLVAQVIYDDRVETAEDVLAAMTQAWVMVGGSPVIDMVLLADCIHWPIALEPEDWEQIGPLSGRFNELVNRDRTSDIFAERALSARELAELMELTQLLDGLQPLLFEKGRSNWNSFLTSAAPKLAALTERDADHAGKAGDYPRRAELYADRARILRWVPQKQSDMPD